ncbi:MAG: exodeoxyribonuclease VII small subunit [Mycoplasmataceae bacterium]|jgi:exodeoxyribonuclease VII small subunit|nr:exodeoxyribonuclease VII small subunit [Mycoplasmataceae bacterium]
MSNNNQSEQNKTKFDYEKAKDELKQIVERLERENIGLQDSIVLFEQGAKLAKECQSFLDEAKKKIEQIKENSNSNGN